MRKVYLATACLLGALLIPAAPAQAAETCNGLPVTISGNANGNLIIGTPGNDVISAGAGNDIVSALSGDDTVCLGPGDDVLDGGPGTDTMVADATPDGRDVFVGNSAGASEGDVALYSARTTPVNVSLDGIDNDGAAGEGDNIDAGKLVGGSAADVLSSGTKEVGIHLVGGAGGDTLISNAFTEGGAGDDTISLIAGASGGTFFGGDGNDTITGGPNRDTISGDDGNDKINGAGGDDAIFGGFGDDVLNGFLGADNMSGDEGNDTLIGGLGDDVIAGGAGNDSFDGLVTKDGRDLYIGGAGTDTADYRTRQFGPTTVLSLSLDGVANDGEPGEGDNLLADIENVNGGVGSNVITGNGGPNVLRGGTQGDTIRGADGIPGNDSVIGGLGIDSCTADPGDTKDCES